MLHCRNVCTTTKLMRNNFNFFKMRDVCIFDVCVCVLVGGSLSAFKKKMFLLVYKALFIFPCICFVLWKTWVLLFFLNSITVLPSVNVSEQILK